mmetsp:Transcript_16243/g.41149  ORF Transcript_16243/g.41149 Transcript_16243/m.41149 type:complete len:500 (-) Transcript_16243:307-1806(-)
MSGKEYDSTLSPTVDGTPKEVNFGGDYQELGGDEVKVSFSEPAVGGEEATASDALLRKDIESKMGERRPVEEGFSVGDQTPHPRAPPQENRNSGMGRALANIIKANLGSGLLSLPFAFTQAGVAVGTVLILIVALLAIHCMTLLAKCKKHMPEHSATYGEIAKYAMGKAGTYLVNVFVTISQLGFCCAYLIFIANNISALIHNGDVCDDRWMFILGLLVVMIPLVLLRTLKFLGVLSIIGNVCIFSGVGIVSVYTIMHYAPVDVEIAVWDTFPSFFGTAVFTYEGIALVVPVEDSMRKPEKFRVVLLVGMLIVSVMYVGFGLLGYLSFGKDVQAEIMVNMYVNEHPTILSTIVAILLSIALASTFPVQLVPVIQSIEKSLNLTNYHIPIKWRELKRNAIRTAIVLFAGAIAISIPHFGLFVSLVGGLGCAMIAFTIPSICHYKIFGKDLPWYVKSKDILIAAFGVIGGIACTYTTTVSLIAAFNGPNYGYCTPPNATDG